MHHERRSGHACERGVDRLPARCHAVGRLDKDSEGLLLLTSDGRVTNALLKSKQRKEKVYEVTTARGVASTPAQLRRGIMLTTRRAATRR